MKYLLNLFRCYKLFEFTYKRVYNCEWCGIDFKKHCDVYIDETIICKTCSDNLKVQKAKRVNLKEMYYF